ncbi:MAG: FG-GAP-like repeat-containing protein [Verrucomicrobiota bacterium]|nr:FG-GAP-like repeat-containing protein [Verrucomicrobiota bacterium]
MRTVLLAMALMLGWGCNRSGQQESTPAQLKTEAKPKLTPPTTEVTSDEVTRRRDDRLAWRRGDDRPFTGVVIDRHPNGQKELEIPFKDGRIDGVWRQWNPAGELVARSYYEADELWEKLEGKDARQVEAKFRKREELDATVWKSEDHAQQYEESFVAFWDALRTTSDKWEVFRRFPPGRLTLGKPGAVTKHDWGILVTAYAGAGRLVESGEWPTFLDELSAQGYEIHESEWHQESFFAPEEGQQAKSHVRFLLHVTSGTDTRLALRGTLVVTWSDKRDARGLYLPQSVDASDLKVLERQGPAAFVKVKLIDTARDRPVAKRAPQAAPLLAYDLDRDGLPELLLPAANLVYWNRGGKLEKDNLCKVPPEKCGSAVVADFTGDGWADLFVAETGGTAILYQGDKHGRFDSDPTVAAGLELKVPFASTAGDIDGDGDLDLWVTQYRQPYRDGQMPTPYYDANDGWSAYLLINDGNGIFTDKTERAGLAAKRRRRTYSTSFVDLNDDHHLDLVVVNDFAGLDIWLNDGHGKFTDVTAQLGNDRFSFGMSHALADFNRDGRVDLYMTGMGSTTARRLEGMSLGRAEFPGHQDHRMKLGYGNRLFLGGDKGLRQAPYNDSVARTGWSWGCAAFDFDSDGDEDIFIANGHRSGSTCRDYCTIFWRHDIYTGDSREDPLMDSYFNESLATLAKMSWNGFEHNVLYQNEGDGAFVNVAWLLNVAHEYDSRSVLAEDLDADGRPDLMVGQVSWTADNQDLPNYVNIVRNQMSHTNNWVGVRLHEHGPGRSPIGAEVRVLYNGRRAVRHVVTGDSYRAQHSGQKHFGIGAAKSVDAIEVRWPNAQVSRLEKPAINQYHTLSPPRADAP